LQTTIKSCDVQYIIKNKQKMAYTLNQASNNMAIKECEYGSAAEVKFTAFTSCIGILAKKKSEDKVIGIHLVITNKSGDKFDQAAAQTVKTCLDNESYDSSDVILLGSLDIWNDPQNGVKDGYDKLLALIQPTKKYQFGDGTYGGTIEDGKVEVTY
jgi:hypothetical protein